VLRQVEAGERVADICRKVWISPATYNSSDRQPVHVGLKLTTGAFAHHFRSFSIARMKLLYPETKKASFVTFVPSKMRNAALMSAAERENSALAKQTTMCNLVLC
jgi:hypothetical protein